MPRYRPLCGRKQRFRQKRLSRASFPEQIEKKKPGLCPLSDSSAWTEELHAGIARAMQYYVSEYKTEKLLTIGLENLKRIEEQAVPQLYASDPHKLMRSLEDTSLLACAQAVVQASLARKASSVPLNFQRIDYPVQDPPEWNKYLTIRQEEGQVVTGELPQRFWVNMKEQ